MASYTPNVGTSFSIGQIKVVNSGNLRAMCDVTIGSLTIAGWRIVMQPGQRAYVSAPQAQYLDKKTGRTAYAPLIKVQDPELAEAIRAAILRAWERTTGNSPAHIFDDVEAR